MKIDVDLVFQHIIHDVKRYKVMIDGGRCVNIISKITIEKMDFKAEFHP